MMQAMGDGGVYDITFLFNDETLTPWSCWIQNGQQPCVVSGLKNLKSCKGFQYL